MQAILVVSVSKQSAHYFCCYVAFGVIKKSLSKPSSVVDPRCFARALPFAWASVSEAATVYADAQPGNAIPRILADASVSKLLLVQRNQLVHSENHVCDEHQTVSFNCNRLDACPSRWCRPETPGDDSPDGV